jgi:hypothetical protein
MFKRNIVQKIRTDIAGTIKSFFKNLALYEINWKNCKARQATHDKMHCMLDT